MKLELLICDRCGKEARDLNAQAKFSKDVQIKINNGEHSIGDLCESCNSRLMTAILGAIDEVAVVPK